MTESDRSDLLSLLSVYVVYVLGVLLSVQFYQFDTLEYDLLGASITVSAGWLLVLVLTGAFYPVFRALALSYLPDVSRHRVLRDAVYLVRYIVSIMVAMSLVTLTPLVIFDMAMKQNPMFFLNAGDDFLRGAGFAAALFFGWNVCVGIAGAFLGWWGPDYPRETAIEQP